MSDAKHTPGPWVLDPCFDVLAPSRIGPRDNGMVCSVTVDADMLDEATANARLIAAAPDLLAALRRLMPVVPVLPYGAKHIHGLAEEYDAALAAARAAIAKAEGRDA